MFQIKSGKIGCTVRTALLAAGLLMAMDSVAHANPTTDTFVVPVASGSEPLGGYHIQDVLGGIGVDLTVAAQAKWTANITTDVTYDPQDVRQGANLEVSRSAPVTVGSLKTLWTVTGSVFGIDIGSVPLSIDAVTCAPRFSGDAYDCTATSDGLTLLPSIFCDPLSAEVSLSISIKFTISPEAAHTTRNMSVDDFSFPTEELELASGAASESFPMPCTKPAGVDVSYKLDPYHWTPVVTAVEQPHIKVGIPIPIAPPFVCPVGTVYDAPVGPSVTTHPNFDLTGAGHTTDMGELAANNVAPTVAAFPVFSGVEGTPVAFSATTTSACPITGYVWQFSDGTTSFGPSPQRAFGDDAVYNGQLTVTDITNLSGTKSFNVTVSNVAPKPEAGPATSAAWGRPIQFHGQAVDPGWDDQGTLVYSWDWGDGTPGTGGANATHTYTTPGNYFAKLTVCDDHGCANDSTAVLVRTRSTFLAYTGPNTGVYSASSTLRAALIDEFGAPVTFGPVEFALAGTPVGISQSDGFGNAAITTVVNDGAGTYSVEAVYNGSQLYDYSQASASFTVSQMSSVISYTGAISGGPNKTITLSAYLTDGLGRPLDGHTVVFTLGTQQVTAVTGAAGATGVAVNTLKLNQKNGKYMLTAVWSPSLSEASRWTGASTAVSFSVQSK